MLRKIILITLGKVFRKIPTNHLSLKSSKDSRSLGMCVLSCSKGNRRKSSFIMNPHFIRIFCNVFGVHAFLKAIFRSMVKKFLYKGHPNPMISFGKMLMFRSNKQSKEKPYSIFLHSVCS